jgi:hypothetical protein
VAAAEFLPTNQPPAVTTTPKLTKTVAAAAVPESVGVDTNPAATTLPGKRAVQPAIAHVSAVAYSGTNYTLNGGAAAAASNSKQDCGQAAAGGAGAVIELTGQSVPYDMGKTEFQNFKNITSGAIVPVSF